LFVAAWHVKSNELGLERCNMLFLQIVQL